MQEADLPEFASPSRSTPEEHPVHSAAQGSVSQQYPGGLTPEFGDMDEDIPEPAVCVPQPVDRLPVEKPSPTRIDSTPNLGQNLSSQTHKRPVSHSFTGPVPPAIPEETGKEEEPVETFISSSTVDALLVDLYRYTSQTGGRVSSQLKSRIAQLVSQFAVRAHNLPTPSVKSKVKGQIQGQPKPPPRRNDPLGDLNKAIEGFTVKIAGDIQRIKDPVPVTQVVVSAFLELLREIGNLELLMHPHRTMWEVFLLLMQQPGAAVTLVRSLPKRIKAAEISKSKL